MVNFWVGQHASVERVVTEGDLTVIHQFVLENPPACGEPIIGSSGQWSGQEVLIGSLINGLLNICLPGPGSTLLSQQFEYLAAVNPGDTLTARVEVITWQPEKRLVTLKTDCFNQARKQILTGQAVLVVAAASTT